MQRTFAIGDIHGESALLADLLRQIHAAARTGDSLVLLGDYINRGPDSRGVIDLILAQRQGWPGPVITLMGNHEQMLRDNLLHKSPGTWMRYRQAMTGEPTCRSYGAEDLSLVRFEAHLPPEHRRFIVEELPLWHEDEHAVYVHAGIPPGRHPRDCVPESWRGVITRYDTRRGGMRFTSVTSCRSVAYREDRDGSAGTRRKNP